MYAATVKVSMQFSAVMHARNSLLMVWLVGTLCIVLLSFGVTTDLWGYEEALHS